MDPQTLAAYDANAQAFAHDWHAQPAPADLQCVGAPRRRTDKVIHRIVTSNPS
jgi:hypothetical protein